MLIIRRPLTGYLDYGIKFDTVQVYGIFAQPSSVDVNGNQITNPSQIQYDKTNKVRIFFNHKLTTIALRVASKSVRF